MFDSSGGQSFVRNAVCFSWAGLHYSLEIGFQVLQVSVRVTLEFIQYRDEMGFFSPKGSGLGFH